MGDFDKILKENVERIVLTLAAKYLGFTIAKIDRIREKLQLAEREVDFAAIVDTQEGEKFILHLEFQTRSDSLMLLRNAEYHGIWLRQYDLEIKHFVIYLGSPSPNMATELAPGKIYKGFSLVNLHEFDPEKMLASTLPEEVMLAVLSRFEKDQAEVLIRRILWRLGELSTDEKALKKYIRQLTILSRLRKLETQTKKQAEEMPITYDIKTDGLYLEGREEGRKKGQEYGERQKTIEVIQRTIQRFPEWTDEEIAELAGSEVALVEEVRRQQEKG
jgi:predicted transposase YdaD